MNNNQQHTEVDLDKVFAAAPTGNSKAHFAKPENNLTFYLILVWFAAVFFHYKGPEMDFIASCIRCLVAPLPVSAFIWFNHKEDIQAYKFENSEDYDRAARIK